MWFLCVHLQTFYQDTVCTGFKSDIFICDKYNKLLPNVHVVHYINSLNN